MKNLKKLQNSQLKNISGGVNLPEQDFCMYYCNGIIVCATCSDDFKCPDASSDM